MAPAIAPDTVLSFEINPGTLLQLLEARAETGPRLKCFEGNVTLVAAGMSHGIAVARISNLILAVGPELRIKHAGLGSTTWTSPLGAGDTAYEADASYYVRNFGQSKENQPPDLAIEVVVSHCETIALRAGAFLKIPELWVLDIPRHRLTFYHLAARASTRELRIRPRITSRSPVDLGATWFGTPNPCASAVACGTGSEYRTTWHPWLGPQLGKLFAACSLPAVAPEPGLPRPHVRRGPRTARRPRGRGHRLPRKLPRMGQASPRPSRPSGGRRSLKAGGPPGPNSRKGC
jgi:Uma2 family endonuclease